MKRHSERVFIVEGKYDRARLLQIVDATIMETNGFQLFSDNALMQTLSTLAKKRGAVILTDSDRAGFLIRTRLIQALGEENIINVYIPDILGKERRKQKPSKEGLLGVEGIENSMLLKILEDAGVFSANHTEKTVSKTDFYRLGLSGGKNSFLIRKQVAAHLGLPARLSAGRLADAISAVSDLTELEKIVAEITKTAKVLENDNKK